MKNDSFGDRMKAYEAVSESTLQRKTPVILRIDGCHFHTFTRNLHKPFDEIFLASMQETMKYLCEHIQGCVFGYTQSDEITLVLLDTANENTDAWFGYRVQKMTSVAASMAAMKFNEEFRHRFKEFVHDYYDTKVNYDVNKNNYIATLKRCKEMGAYFDCRAFSIPLNEVVNAIYWRQSDAIRNSILSYAQSKFGHKAIMNKSCKELITMMNGEWERLPIKYQRGVACHKTEAGWTIDYNMPILKADGRSYLETLL